MLILFTRAKIGEGKKSLEEVMDWYNRINTDTLYYVTYSIPDSDVSDFYRWIIGKTKKKFALYLSEKKLFWSTYMLYKVCNCLEPLNFLKRGSKSCTIELNFVQKKYYLCRI
jgi:hypothetical protein